MPKTYPKLRGRITEKFGTINAFADVLGTQTQQVSRKLNVKVAITQDDVYKWSELLDIKTEDIGAYFFPQKVQEKSN